MFSRFFIDRPIFAAVLSIVITLAGAVSVINLPLAQYPPITPPSIIVSCTYPGASAQVVAESIAAPIEQQVNGVENMLYMSSQSNNDGTYSLTVTFKPGVNLNFAQVLVQNRVNLALPLLPDVVKQTGVTTRKRSPDILLLISMISPDGSRDQLYLSNYTTLFIKDEMARMDGVGDVIIFGQLDYSMRLWLEPNRLQSYGLSAGDVVAAVRAQNSQAPVGMTGQPPIGRGQQQQVTLTTLGRLDEVEQFANIVIRTTPDGRMVRVKDVGRVEVAPRTQDILSRFNGVPGKNKAIACANLAIFMLPDANALDTAERVRKKMEELKEDFPPGIDYAIRYDTTPFIRESVNEVVKTLRDATILVALVVLLFLQNWRSTIIPLCAVPVAIVGTFAVMLAIGFSLNNLTLFGLVLAIGIVVDDAIVVVEAVEHHIEHGLAPKEATIRAMQEVSGPVVAVALVLSAVFVPCAFITGITGQFFRQFALTIAVSTVISAFNSLTLSPALAALLLRPRAKGKMERMPRWVFAIFGGVAGVVLLTPWVETLAEQLGHGAAGEGDAHHQAQVTEAAWWYARAASGVAGAAVVGALAAPLNVLLAGFFRLFNFSFERTTNGYTRLVALALRGSGVVLLLYVLLIGITLIGFSGMPEPVVGGVNASVNGYRWLSGTEEKQEIDSWFGKAEWVVQYDLARALGRKKIGSLDPLKGLPVGYIPPQDKGQLFISVQLPDAASLERTRQAVQKVDRICKDEPGVNSTISITGQSFVLGANGSNFGQMFLILDDFDERRDASLYSDRIAERLRAKLEKEVPEANCAVFGPAPVQGLGIGGGFKFVVEDRGDLGLTTLEDKANAVITAGNQTPGLVGLFTVFRANSPQLFVDVDRSQCAIMEVDLQDVFTTLQVYLGSLYVNDFNKFGRTWQVIIQAEADSRNDIEDVKNLKVRSSKGAMVPLGSVATVKEINGPLLLTRYNMYPAAIVNGAAGPGVASGEAIRLVEAAADKELPRDMAIEWTEISYIQITSGNTATVIFSLSVLFVFLVLAAQYESWSLPLAVILVVPMCILGSLIGVIVSNSDINIFTQIGFVVLVGLASKNAILIVEFAKHKREAGEDRVTATLEACRLRLRPILMTSFAFILGVVPLLISQGAGKEMRQTLGTAVFSGMLGVTLFGIFLTPVFFYVIDRVSHSRLFGSAPMRTAGTLLLYGLFIGTLGVAWLLWLLFRELRRRELLAMLPAVRRPSPPAVPPVPPVPPPSEPAAETRMRSGPGPTPAPPRPEPPAPEDRNGPREPPWRPDGGAG
jgi:multidrug efflux pump